MALLQHGTLSPPLNAPFLLIKHFQETTEKNELYNEFVSAVQHVTFFSERNTKNMRHNQLLLAVYLICLPPA